VRERSSQARLESAGDQAVLLVDVAEALALLAVLVQAGSGEDEHAGHAAHAEDGGEDVINKNVGEAADGYRAAAHEGGGSRAGAGGVGDEGRGGAVEVAAAVELFVSFVSHAVTRGGLVFTPLARMHGRMRESQRTAVCMRSWTVEFWALHSGAKSSLVLSVKIQTSRPSTSETTAVMVTRPPLILSQILVGMVMAGMVVRKLTK